MAQRDRVLSNLEQVRGRIARAAERAGRDPAEVTLVAATKLVPTEAIRWVVDDALGEEVRVTVIAAGFDRVSTQTESRFESRLSRLLEEPAPAGREEPLPSILADDDEVVFTEHEQQPSVSFDAEEDLDIPDFLKS